MHSRKPGKKKKQPSTLSLSPDETTLLNQLLSDLGGIDLSDIPKAVPSQKLAQALIEKLPVDVPETVGLVFALRDAYDRKEVRKAVKKVLFKLKQRGISLPDSDSPEETPYRVQKILHEDPAAFVGPFDGMGFRPIFLALPQLPKGIDVGLGLISDSQGIIEFIFNRTSKKRMKELKEVFFNQVGTMIKTSLPHAATILEKAYSLNKSGSNKSAGGYLQLRPWILGNVTLLERPVVYDLISPENVPRDILTVSQMGNLLEHELMVSWIIDPDEMKPLVEEIIKAQESPIFISEDQKAGRIREIKEKGVSDLFPLSKRLIMKDRLEETAYVLLKMDEEEYARLCLTSALSLEETDSVLSVNPFLKALLERHLDYFLNGGSELGKPQAPEEDSAPNIIIP